MYEAGDLRYWNKRECISLSEEENTMRVIKEICFFAVLALMIMPAACAVAALTPRLLPSSTFAAQEDNWRGQKWYEEDGLNILVEFCVYDSENLLMPAETQLVEALGLSGRYIYAYQIWNHSESDTGENEVGAFQLLDIEGEEISESAYKDDTGCHDDSTAGVAPTPPVSTKQGAWTFASGDLILNTHSQFLVFSSDSAPVAGTFDITTPSSEFPVPEPGTIALLGVASGLFAARRRNKRPGG